MHLRHDIQAVLRVGRQWRAPLQEGRHAPLQTAEERNA